MAQQGTIASLNEKGFGFLKVEGRKNNLFFHAKDVVNTRFDQLEVGNTMEFEEIQETDKGEAARGVSIV